MPALIIPPWIIPEREEQPWLDEASSVFEPSFAPGVSQRQSFGGLRMKLSRFHRVRQEEMAVLLSALMDTDGRYNAVYSKVHYGLRGSFPASELISNNTFESGTTGWTSSSAEVAIAVSDRALRARRTALTAAQTVRATAATVTSAVYYLARVFVRTGLGTPQFRIRLGTSAGGNEIAESGANITTQGLHELAGLASGTTMHLSVWDDNAGRSVGDYYDILYVSLARCILVNGAGQNGAVLTVDQLPVSTNGNLLTFDWVSIGGELKMVTSPLTSTSASAGYLQFKPQLFRAPADNAPITIVDPMGKFLASAVKPDNQFGLQADVSYELEHIYE